MNIAFVEDNYTRWEREGAFLSTGVSSDSMLTKWESTMDIYASVLTKMGHRCIKYVPSLTSGAIESYTHRLGHPVAKVPCLGSSSIFLRKLDWRLSALSFTTKIDGHEFMRNCDLVHYHSFYSSYFLTSPRLRNPKRRTAHYTGGRFPSDLSFPRKSIALRLLRHALKTSDGILLDSDDPESREQAKFLTQIMGLPAAKLYSFATILVDRGVFKERDKLRSRLVLHMSKNDFIILAVTSVIDEPLTEDRLAKNPFRLVRIFKKLLANSEQNIELHIVGAGPGLEALKELVDSLHLETRVVIHGAVTHHEVSTYVAASDLVFVPYHFQALTFGTAVFEAFACGRPVSGFKRFESTPLECPGGFLIDLDDSRAACQLAERISDSGYLSRKAQEGTVLAVNHDATNLGMKLESIFENILTK